MNNFEMVKLAIQQLGNGGAIYRKYCGLPAGAPWCNAYVTWLFHKSDNKNLYCNGTIQISCPNSIQWCYKNLALLPIYLVMPGDVVYFDWEPNGVPNHVGIVEERETDQIVKTIEGNTSGSQVARKRRTDEEVQGVFRPHFHVDSSMYTADKPLVVDSYFGYSSIAVMQKWLGVSVDAIIGQQTVKALQKRLDLKQDGWWGPKTSKAVQRLIGAEADGYFGPKSVRALQTYLNKQVFNAVAVPSKAQQINDMAIKYAWPAGTDVSKYRKKGGSADPDFIKAWKTYFPQSGINTGCHSYVKLVLKSLGYPTMDISSWSKILKYLRANFDELEVNYTQQQLKVGDIRVHKNSSGGYHIWIIVREGGKWYRAEANQGTSNDRYAHLNGSTGGNTKKHKGDWLFRAK